MDHKIPMIGRYSELTDKNYTNLIGKHPKDKLL